MMLYNSIRGHTFRIPTRPLLAIERWLVRRALLRRPLLRNLINNCRVVVVKARVA